MTRRRRRVVAGVVIAALALSAIAARFAPTGGAPAAAGTAAAEIEGELPTALGNHLNSLRQAVPGNGGESPEGPGTADEQAFMARAYPASDISIEKLNAARSAAEALANRFPKGKGRPGTWVTVGPSTALYPLTPFRGSFNYVPNAYVAGGRTTALAIGPTCNPGHCRLWIATSGGGIWRTDNALNGEPSWKYLGGPLGINATGEISLDPNDPTGNTLYAGTGEANVCGSGCVAGVGIYKSTDGGDTWSGLIGAAELGGKGVGDIVVKPGSPNTIYAATTTALRGLSSVCCSGVTRPVPGAAKWGLYKSTNGGTSWSFIHNGTANAADCTGSNTEFLNGGACSPRGVRHVELDPSNPEIVYASSYARGIWRSPDGGATWTQIKPSLNPAVITTRAAIDVTTKNGKTRMYAYEGNVGSPTSRLFRSDDVSTGAPVFASLTSSSVADSGWAWHNLCGGQCWYDVFVHTPEGHPDTVYAGGAYLYGETIANKRGVILSTDAGLTGTDMTFDGTDELHPNGLHPDQHALVVNPSNPMQFFEANDGGVMRSSGDFVDRSSSCAGRGFVDTAGSTAAQKLARCQQMLSRIPSRLESMNKGLTTLQFMSLSVSPHNSKIIQGGTQDNGTWETNGSPVKWENTMIGDGGQSGFDVAKKEFRFHTFFDASPDVNFANGDIGSWIWIADPIFGHPGTQFYAPIISDPKVSGTMFAGTGFTAYRTKTHGLGNRTLAQANAICNEWFGTFAEQCGDWAALAADRNHWLTYGDLLGCYGTLVPPAVDPPQVCPPPYPYGTDRDGGAVAAIERTTKDASTAWAATTTGRVFVSTNVDADPATAVSWTRIDSATTPGRFVSSIYVDPANGNHAWVSYSGYNATTPTTPGHVFEVTYNPSTGTATWVDRSYDLNDLPITDLVRDDVTGDLYAASDFGVMRLGSGETSWTSAAPGMPHVEVAGLTIVTGDRILYAATHGLGAWRLNLG